MIRARADVVGTSDLIRVVAERTGEADVVGLHGMAVPEGECGGCGGAARVDVVWDWKDCAVVGVVTARSYDEGELRDGYEEEEG